MLLIVGGRARCDQSEAALANEAITIMWGFCDWILQLVVVVVVGGKMVIFPGEWNVKMKRGERDRSISR